MSEAVVDGRVAQLGEHLLCKQGVTGSIPVTSTNVLLDFLRSSSFLVPKSVHKFLAKTDTSDEHSPFSLR
jgi:hypothetical protein